MSPQPTRLENLTALLLLAGPIAVSQLAQTSMGFVDTVMVGRLGPTDLAAVSLGSAVFFGILVFALGVLLGVGPIVAQAVGAEDERTIGEAGRAGLGTTLLVTPVVLILMFLARGQLSKFIDDPAVVELAQGYLGAVSWSVLPYLGFIALRSWLEALNRPLIVTAFTVVTVAVNVFGNYVFVYGAFGFPQLGAVGTGYATSLSNVFLFLGLGTYTLLQSDLRPYWTSRLGSYFLWPRIREILRVGGPIGFSFGIEVGLFSATAVLVGGLGAEQLAAHQIVIQCAAMAFMLPLSVALASSIRVGNLVGAGKEAIAREAGWLGIAFGASLMIVSATLFVLFPDWLLWVFLGEVEPNEARVAATATGLLAFAGAFQVADGIQATAAGALRGLKDTLAPMIIGLISYWGVGLTTGYLLAPKLGVYGYWSGLVLGLVVAAILLTLRWWRRSKRLAGHLNRKGVETPRP